MTNADAQHRLRNRSWNSGRKSSRQRLAGHPQQLSTETMAHQGWDSLTVDMQHGAERLPGHGHHAAGDLDDRHGAGGARSLARARHPDEALDAGAYAVICPDGQSRARMRRSCVAWTSYPPRGMRSFGPVRALLYGGADYPQHATTTIVVFAHDRDRRRRSTTWTTSVASKGSTAVYIGPSDLSPVAGLYADHGRPGSGSAAQAMRAHHRAGQGARPAWQAFTTQRRDGAGTHRQGLPVRHRQLRRAPDRRRCTAGDGQDARRPDAAHRPAVPTEYRRKGLQ